MAVFARSCNELYTLVIYGVRGCVQLQYTSNIERTIYKEDNIKHFLCVTTKL